MPPRSRCSVCGRCRGHHKPDRSPSAGPIPLPGLLHVSCRVLSASTRRTGEASPWRSSAQLTHYYHLWSFDLVSEVDRCSQVPTTGAPPHQQLDRRARGWCEQPSTELWPGRFDRFITGVLSDQRYKAHVFRERNKGTVMPL